jgi:hypothetical protein
MHAGSMLAFLGALVESGVLAPAVHRGTLGAPRLSEAITMHGDHGGQQDQRRRFCSSS